MQLVKYIIGLVVSEENISKSETRLSNGGPDFIKQRNTNKIDRSWKLVWGINGVQDIHVQPTIACLYWAFQVQHSKICLYIYDYQHDNFCVIYTPCPFSEFWSLELRKVIAFHEKSLQDEEIKNKRHKNWNCKTKKSS